MTPGEVDSVAAAFVAKSYDRPLEFAAHARPSPRDKDVWIVAFLVRGEGGSMFDGPLMVLVDDKSGRARFRP